MVVGEKIGGMDISRRKGGRLQIGGGSAALFKPEDSARSAEGPALPKLANWLYYELVGGTLGASTRAALDKAATPQEWNALLLSSPEFMYR